MRLDEGADILCFVQSTRLSTVELSLTNNIDKKALTRNSSEERVLPPFFDQKRRLFLSRLPRELLLLTPRRADPCYLLNKSQPIPHEWWNLRHGL
jgi:hypothetical protein